MKNIITFNLFEMSKVSNFYDKKKELITYLYTDKVVYSDLIKLKPLLSKEYGEGELNLFPDFYSENKKETLDFLEEELLPQIGNEDYFGLIFTLFNYTCVNRKEVVVDLDFDDEMFQIFIRKNYNKDETFQFSNDIFKETNVKLIWNKIFNRIKANI
jgi:hypothetical protein